MVVLSDFLQLLFGTPISHVHSTAVDGVRASTIISRRKMFVGFEMFVETQVMSTQRVMECSLALASRDTRLFHIAGCLFNRCMSVLRSKLSSQKTGVRAS